ncbi:MAG: acyltransferase [Clostridiales Family XIII bacterium]|nr:acyltransferase [Clostridiales Family XIII bacterium]
MKAILGKLIYKLKLKVRGWTDIDALKKKGFVCGDGLHVGRGTVIDPDYCWLIRLGDNVGLGPNVHLLAHDSRTRDDFGVVRVAPVVIGDNVALSTRVIVMPGVTIGDNVAVGVGSVVYSDIPSNSVVVGNPARRLGRLTGYMDDLATQMDMFPKFDESWTLRGNITGEMKAEMIQILRENAKGFVR